MKCKTLPNGFNPEDVYSYISKLSNWSVPKGWKLEGTVSPFAPLLYFKGDRKAVIEAVATEQGLTEENIRSFAIQFFNEAG